jgi:hypothetical protein
VRSEKEVVTKIQNKAASVLPLWWYKTDGRNQFLLLEVARIFCMLDTSSTS